MRRAEVQARIDPPAASTDSLRPHHRPRRVFLRAVGVIVLVPPIDTPLPDVAVHVEEAPGVGLVRPHLAGPPKPWPLPGAPIGKVAVEVRLERGERIDGNFPYGGAG